ncbi:MAG: hypothetical protein ACLUOI_20285 [Eisenbergiella sp.]
MLYPVYEGVKDRLHGRKVDGAFDDLNEKSTKDKNIVHQKMNLLESLMDEFLHITRRRLWRSSW